MAKKKVGNTVNEGLLQIPKEVEEEMVKAVQLLINKKKSYWKHIFQVLMVKANEEYDPQTLWYMLFLSRLKTEVRLDMAAPAGVYYDFNLNPDDKVKREGYTLVVNPVYFSLFDKEEQLAILKHEIQHIFKMHFARFDPEIHNHTIANIAEDLEINGFYNNPNIRNLPGSKDKPNSLYSGCFIETVLDKYVEQGILKGYDKSKVKQAEYYYDLISQNPELKKQILLEYEEKKQNRGRGGKGFPIPKRKLEELIKERIREINENFGETNQDNSQMSKEELEQRIKETEDMLRKLKELNGESPEQENQQQGQQGQQQGQQGQQGQQQGQQGQQGQQQGQQGQQQGQQGQQQGQQGQQQGQQGQQPGQQQGQQGQQGKSEQDQKEQSGQSGQGKEQSDKENNEKGSSSGSGKNNKDEKKIGYDLDKIKEDLKEKQKEGKGKKSKKVEKGGKPDVNKSEQNDVSSGLDDLRKKLNDLTTKVAREMLKAIKEGRLRDKILDDHDIDTKPEGISDEEAKRRRAKELERHIKNVQDIFDNISNPKDRGYSPSEVRTVLNNIKKIVKPQVDLRKELKKSITDGITKAQNYIRTKQRPHLLYPKDPNYKGKIPDKLPQIVVVLDVSGSMSDVDILAGINEIRNLAKQLGNVPVKLVQVDTEVHSVDEINFNMSSFERKGQGGTYLEPAFEFIFDQEGPIKYANVIVSITDGYIESEFENFKLNQHPELKKVIWLTTTKELNFNIKPYKEKMKQIYLDPEAFARAYKAVNKNHSSPSL